MKKKFRRWIQIIFGDFGNKSVALLVAVVLWFHISEEITATRTFDIPIQFVFPKKGPYKDAKVVWTNLKEVRVRLRGPKAKMAFMPPNLAIRPVILDGTPKGEKVVIPLTESYLNLPSGIVCTSISPPKVAFILSRVVHKKIPVILDYNSSSAPSNYFIEYFQPKRVFVKGPEYLLKQLKKVRTSPIDWRAIPSSSIETYSVQIPDKFKGELSCEQTVSVKFRVSQPLEQISLFLGVSILLSENFPYKIDLHTKKIKLLFQGPKKELEKLKSDPQKYADIYIVPEELDSSDIKPMDKNKETPKSLNLKVFLDPQLKNTRLLNNEDSLIIEFYILKK